jgi:hypothetical protein
MIKGFMLPLLTPTLFKLRDDIVVVAILLPVGRGTAGVKFYNDTTNECWRSCGIIHRPYFAA